MLPNKNLNLFLGILSLIFLFILLVLKNTSESIAGDEAYSIFNSLTSVPAIIDLSMKDQNPPLYLFTLKLWTSVFGISTFAVRALSAVYATATIAIFFRLIKRIYNPKIALLASILMIATHSFFNFGQEVRCYALMLLLAILSIDFMERFWHSNKKVYLVLYTIVSLLLIFTHYLTVFFIFTQFVAILYTKNVGKIKPFLVSWIAVAALLSPWAIFIVNNMPERGSFWLQSPAPIEFYFEWAKMFNSKVFFLVFVGMLLLTLIFFWSKNEVIKNLFVKKENGLNWNTFFFLLALLPSVLEFLVAQITPIFIMRYYYYSLIGVVVILAHILISLYKIKPYLGIVFIAATVILYSIAFSLHPTKSENWRDMVALVKERKLDQYQILITPSYKTKELYYYLDRPYFEHVTEFKEQNDVKDIYGVMNDVTSLQKIPSLKDSIIVFLEHGDAHNPNNKNITEYLSKTHELKEYVNIPNYRNGLLIFHKKQ